MLQIRLSRLASLPAPHFYFLQNGNKEEQLFAAPLNVKAQSRPKLTLRSSRLVVPARGRFNNCPISKLASQFNSY